MSAITLAQAERIIDAIFERGSALNCRPLSAIVVEPGCKVKAFKKEDGSSMIRFEMAYGKAYAALSLGRSSKLVRERAQDIDPSFFNSRLSDGDILFIDSTHTVKHGSDCLHIYLQVLPKLTVDVTIHAHDIYLPLPQPAQNMLDRQIYWTEQYLLYAYLIGNDRTGVDYGSTWHMQENADALRSFMCGRYPPGGASLWFSQKSRSGVR